MMPTPVLRRRVLAAAAALAVCATVGAAGEETRGADELSTNVLAGRTMGTTYQVRYWGDGQAAEADVAAAVESLLAKIDEQMSTYRDDSEIARFNRAPGGEWFDVSPDTAAVVAAALQYHGDTDGALDVTVAPLLRAWRLGPHALPGAKAPPTADELQEALRTVGARHLEVRRDPPALRKDLAAVEVELSSLAPGYAVDLLVEQVRELGFANVMVELGGEVRAIGRRAGGEPWRIGVESPARGGRTLARVVPLSDLALSTAGDYRITRTVDGKRYTHIVDPRTGEALPHRGVAVTVLAATCLEADALDTPLLVMGADDGYQWCVEHDVAAMFQTRAADGRIAVRTTPEFDKLVPPTGGGEDRNSLGPTASP